MLLARAKVSLPSQTSLTIEEEALRIDVFWEALAGYSFESVGKAFQRSYEELKWFPRPADIIELILDDNEKTYQSKNRLIEWARPTEESKRIAKEMIRQSQDKWAREDLEAKRIRAENFEKSREKLKRQARLLREAKA